MLIRFTVKNFASFHDEQSLSMLKGRGSKLPHHINEDQSGNFQTLRGSVIYGANASGKSNIIEAMRYAHDFIVTNSKSEKNKSFKLSKKSIKEPSSFDFEFKVNKKAYSYGFESTGKEVIREWLYEISNTKKDKLIFERSPKINDKTDISFGSGIIASIQDSELKDLKAIASSTPDDTLFLYDAKNRKIKLFLEPLSWFEEKLLILKPESWFDDLDVFSKQRDGFISFLSKLLNAADVGIDRVELKREEGFSKFQIPPKLIEKISNDLKEGASGILNIGRLRLFIISEKNKLCTYRLVTVHKSKSDGDVVFELEDESDGTRRLVDLAPAFYSANTPDRVLVIDELDRSLHPKITEMLHDAHYNDSTRVNGQLIMATHEHYLLSQDFYRRDEIWFVEKDKFGESTLYSLSEYKVRHDKDIEKDYLLGRYGATPYVRKLDA